MSRWVYAISWALFCFLVWLGSLGLKSSEHVDECLHFRIWLKVNCHVFQLFNSRQTWLPLRSLISEVEPFIETNWTLMKHSKWLFKFTSFCKCTSLLVFGPILLVIVILEVFNIRLQFLWPVFDYVHSFLCKSSQSLKQLFCIWVTKSENWKLVLNFTCIDSRAKDPQVHKALIESDTVWV